MTCPNHASPRLSTIADDIDLTGGIIGELQDSLAEKGLMEWKPAQKRARL